MTPTGVNYGSQVRIVPTCARGDKSSQAERHRTRARFAADWRSQTNDEPEQFAPFDGADYIDDIDAAVAYLEAVFEETGDDPAFVAQALRTIARSGNVSELA